MAKDSRVPPLPRRVPGSNRGSGTGPLLPPVVLSEPELQRIRAALDGAADPDDAEDRTSPLQDAAEGKVSTRQNAATSGPPASLPRRVRDPGRGPEPPAGTVRPRLPSPRADEASANELTAISTSGLGRVAEEVTAPPDTSAHPEAATNVSADAKVAPAQPPPAVQHPDQQERQDKAASPEKTSAYRENGQASPEKAQPRRTKAAARPRSQHRRGRRHLRRSHHCCGDGAVGSTAAVVR